MSIKWSYFIKSKSEVAGKVVAVIKALRAKDATMGKYIRCDNAGENKTCEEKCKEEGLDVIFKYTAPSTPQQNGKVERSFATLYEECEQ